MTNSNYSSPLKLPLYVEFLWNTFGLVCHSFAFKVLLEESWPALVSLHATLMQTLPAQWSGIFSHYITVTLCERVSQSVAVSADFWSTNFTLAPTRQMQVKFHLSRPDSGKPLATLDSRQKS